MMQNNSTCAFQQAQFILVEGRPVSLQFPYLNLLLQERPRHGWDEFAHRHPRMERGKRAKIFAPFDALDGYGENLATKHAAYTDKVHLDESEREEINRRLTILHKLTYNSRLAKWNQVVVTVRYYVPCSDENSFSYEIQGQYVAVTGIVQNVDLDVQQAILIDHTQISFDDILSITAQDEKLFEKRWEG